MEYRSNRLIFREFSETDFSLLYSLFSNKSVMQYTLLDRYTAESQLMPYFEQILKNNRTSQNRPAYEYAVFLASDNTFIGMGDIEISFQNESGGCGEMGYLILPQFWGNGYATEIAQKLLEIGFKDAKLHRIVASCNANNAGSENVMKKIGMKKEGEFRKSRFKNNSWQDEMKYAILIDNYQQKYQIP